MVGKGDDARLVLSVDYYIREHKRGVDSMVEQCHPLMRLLHETSFVDDGKDLLRALILIDIDHEMRAAGTRLPVDGAIVIALHIVADLLKLGIVAYLPDLFHPHLHQIVGGSHQFQTAEHEI